MRRLVFLACVSIWCAGSVCRAQSEPRLSIHVYNYAGVPVQTLLLAEQEAARILQSAGMTVAWLDCPLAPEQANQFPACQESPGPTTFSLRLVSRNMAERYHFEPAEFGFTLLSDRGELATSAFVCAECIEALAHGVESRLAGILGCMMAHELGHLLLGRGSHSAAGIMHVPWGHKELDQAAAGTLNFLRSEVRRMRTELEIRPMQLPPRVE